jgi:hypothetical protein
MGPKPTWDRDQAAVGGNMVRLFKLLSAHLDQTVQRRYDTSTILTRLAFETIVNARYLIANFSPELVDSYIRYSLRHERRLWDTITANIENRSGIIQPVEDRMLKSLERAALTAGVTLESINLKDKAPWGGKHLRDKAATLGLDAAYLAAFGGMSHSVHGAWHDLYQFHLETDGDGSFKPNLDWGRPRPQPLFAVGRLAIDAARDFFEFIGGDAALSQVSDRLDDLMDRLYTADRSHEAYLSGRTWPEI